MFLNSLRFDSTRASLLSHILYTSYTFPFILDLSVFLFIKCDTSRYCKNGKSVNITRRVLENTWANNARVITVISLPYFGA